MLLVDELYRGKNTDPHRTLVRALDDGRMAYWAYIVCSMSALDSYCNLLLGAVWRHWSIVSSNDVLDLAYDAVVAIAADGHSLLDPSLDPFAPIAAKQPVFIDFYKNI